MAKVRGRQAELKICVNRTAICACTFKYSPWNSMGKNNLHLI